jgi:FixJ family two-component response regulator
MATVRTLIAVVDDEPAIVTAVARLLRAAQFDVATFTSGAAFLGSLAESKPACVVLDVHMPGMSGLEVQAHLAADPRTNVPVILITAQDSSESQLRVMEERSSAFLRKPMEASVLFDAIRTAIARSHVPSHER